MKYALLTVLTAGILFVMGCASAPGVSPFTEIDLGQDLDATTLARYKAEADKATEAGQTGHMLVLEQTNWWPLGIVAYWRAGSVKAMHGSGGWHYMVSSNRGYGPLSSLFVTKQETTFSGDGKRLNSMGMDGVFFGHIAMFHSMGSRDDAGQWQSHESSHLMCHTFNWGSMHGATSFSLFSSPNPVGVGQ